MQQNIVPQNYKINKKDRNRSFGHSSFLIWFTGLSGSGKSTIANAVEQRLHNSGLHTYVLDGDNVRGGLNSDLDFSHEGRTENIRRIGEVANLMIDAGIIVLSAFVSPYKEDREQVAARVGKENYVEVFISTPVEVCEARDTKGLYEKARKGEIKNLTGVSAPYEAPENPDVEVDHTMTIDEAADKILETITQKIKTYSNE